MVHHSVRAGAQRRRAALRCTVLSCSCPSGLRRGLRPRQRAGYVFQEFSSLGLTMHLSCVLYERHGIGSGPMGAVGRRLLRLVFMDAQFSTTGANFTSAKHRELAHRGSFPLREDSKGEDVAAPGQHERHADRNSGTKKKASNSRRPTSIGDKILHELFGVIENELPPSLPPLTEVNRSTCLRLIVVVEGRQEAAPLDGDLLGVRGVDL